MDESTTCRVEYAAGHGLCAVELADLPPWHMAYLLISFTKTAGLARPVLFQKNSFRWQLWRGQTRRQLQTIAATHTAADGPAGSGSMDCRSWS